MKELLRRLFSRHNGEADTHKNQQGELLRLVTARQQNAAIRLARLEIETDLLKRGKADSRG